MIAAQDRQNIVNFAGSKLLNGVADLTTQKGEDIRQLILSSADESGFAAVGIARYGVLDADRGRLTFWLSGGNQASKAYLERNDRHDPCLLLPNCKSLVVMLFSPQIEKYHTPIRRNLKRLLQLIRVQYPEVNGRGVVDTAPIFEKSWAVRAGLGSVGRNTLLINERLGSNFNIGILLLDVDLPPDAPFERDLCPPHCRACLDACPTGALHSSLGDAPHGSSADALHGSRTLDCRLCLSYISQITPCAPYGCTICQQACPHNNRTVH